jgi:fermentation-respiration switch protein FrsA (DUF1100 family)
MMGRVRIALLIVVTSLAGCGGAGFFFPDQTIVDTPNRHGIRYESLQITAQDGTLLSAWFFPGAGPIHGTVLYLHGTTQNISGHFQRITWLPSAGFNVLALDYRGYGESDGLPSVKGADLDIDAAMRTLLSRADVDPGRIFVFGQSIGGALAIRYVAHSRYRANIRALIADSPFAHYGLIAQEKFAALSIMRPFLVDSRYSPQAAVASITPIPLLLIHGERDDVIGAHHSRLLFEMAEEPKDLWSIPGAGHIEATRSPRVRQRLTSFLLAHCG